MLLKYLIVLKKKNNILENKPKEEKKETRF